jgi:cell division protein FtsW
VALTSEPVAPAGGPVADRPAGRFRGALTQWLDAPLTTYYLLLGATVALTVIGLLMVLSSSSVESLKAGDSPYAVFAKQATFAALGLPLMLIATRLPVRAWRALAWPMLLGSLVLLALVPVIGKTVNGNKNWLILAGIQIQPSEGAKLALVIWGAVVLARKRRLLRRPVHAVVPVVFPVAFGLLGLVMIGHDLGTAMVLIALVGALLWVAGAPLRLFAAAAALAAVAVFLAVQTSQNRMSRISAWTGADCDKQSTCWQATHGLRALGQGGWWGVGLGASKEKWLWLPEAHNDFIFAIIGEELGLAGSVGVVLLFGLLAYGLYRVIARTDDDFVKIATGGVLAWVLIQAMVNIGTVTGLLPVIGIPLPLVSSGGSALITTMVALGMTIGFARREAGAPEALAARPGVVRRSLSVVSAGRWRAPARSGAVRSGAVRSGAVRSWVSAVHVPARRPGGPAGSRTAASRRRGARDHG